MLVKSFIDIDTAKELLAWTETQNLYRNTSNGRYGFYSTLDQLNNHPKCVNEIHKKCQEIVSGVYQEPNYKDFVNEVFINGNVNQHTDETIKGFKHLRCNIMLQKPDIGGQIIIDGKEYDLDVGDMLIVDTSLLHSVSQVKGSKSYKTIVFGFLSHE